MSVAQGAALTEREALMPAAHADTGRESKMVQFVQELASELGKERERHAVTDRRLRQALERQAILGKRLKDEQQEWKSRKQSWLEAHKRHVALKHKYSRLLSTVHKSVARRKEKAHDGERPPRDEPLAVLNNKPGQPAAVHSTTRTKQVVEPPVASAARHHCTSIPVPPIAVPSRLTRRQRAEMPAHTCKDCEKFFKNTGVRIGCEHGLQDAGRHRSAAAMPSTPESFWQMSFEDVDEEGQGVPSQLKDDQTDKPPADSRLPIDPWHDGPIFRRKAKTLPSTARK